MRRIYKEIWKFIQAHRKTRLFGREPDYSTRKLISDEQMQEMDEKFGYTYEGDEYLAILIDRLRDKLELIPNMEPKKWNMHLKKIEGFYVWYWYGLCRKNAILWDDLPDVFSTKEAKKVQIMDMYVEEDGERKYTCCISANKVKKWVCEIYLFGKNRNIFTYWGKRTNKTYGQWA